MNAQTATYAELKDAIQSAPTKWLPALLVEVTKAAIAKKVFRKGGARRVVGEVESGMASDLEIEAWNKLVEQRPNADHKLE